MSTVHRPDDALRSVHTTSKRKASVYLLLQELKSTEPINAPIRKNLSSLRKAKCLDLKAFKGGGSISQSFFLTVVGSALVGTYLPQFSLGMSRAALAGPLLHPAD